ncbi:MAG: class I SAM-dependent rRNA methyltransferase [Bacteroidota bacterium]
MKKIILHKGKERSLILRHPWLFSGAVKKADDGITEGEIVEVFSSAGDYLATGHFHDGSIKVRIFSFERTSADKHFWKEKFNAALKLRTEIGLTHSNQTDCYRLIHGEGDGFPGLIIDVYGKTAVLQAHTKGMYELTAVFSECLKEVLGDELQAIYDKSEDTLGKQGVISSGNKFLFGESQVTTVRENGIQFKVDFIEGQKTGFFLDQRDNRALLRSMSEKRSVLNTFCYSGGFSLAALAGGASSVCSIDSSKKATELAEQNSILNGFDRHEILTQDVFDFLKTDERTFDLVVLDPPAFAKHLSAVEKAMIGYRNLNLHGLRKVRPGGLLFTFSCSQVIDKQLFRKLVFQAAAQSGREVKIVHQLSQSPDHPISIYHPEGEYLKGLVLYVA